MNLEAAASVLSHAFADQELTFVYAYILEELHGDFPPYAYPLAPASPPFSPKKPRPPSPLPLHFPPPPPPPPPLLLFPQRPLQPPFPPPKQPRISYDTAYALAVDRLKYRCTRCTNPHFIRCGKCPFQWKGRAFIDRCRFYHTVEERRGMPSKVKVEALVTELMWGI